MSHSEGLRQHRIKQLQSIWVHSCGDELDDEAVLTLVGRAVVVALDRISFRDLIEAAIGYDYIQDTCWTGEGAALVRLLTTKGIYFVFFDLQSDDDRPPENGRIVCAFWKQHQPRQLPKGYGRLRPAFNKLMKWLRGN